MSVNNVIIKPPNFLWFKNLIEYKIKFVYLENLWKHSAKKFDQNVWTPDYLMSVNNVIIKPPNFVWFKNLIEYKIKFLNLENLWKHRDEKFDQCVWTPDYLMSVNNVIIKPPNPLASPPGDQVCSGVVWGDKTQF